MNKASAQFVLQTGLPIFLAVLGLSLYNVHFHPFMVDDSYIGFRIAKNFAGGNGLVYNAGERVMTSTTTLYALLNGIIWKAVGDRAVSCILFLNAVWHSLTACLLAAFVSRALPEASAPTGNRIVAPVFAALFYATAALVMPVATCGMETPLYTLIICLSFYLYFTEKLALAVVVGCIAFMVRPEGCLVAAVMVLCVLITRRKVYLAHALIIVGIVVPYLAIVQAYYGVVIPQSVAAKSLLFIDRREVVSEFFKAYFFSPKRLPLGFLFFSGVYYSVAVNRKLLPFLLWGVLYGSLFTFTASWWRWYKPPFYMVYSCFVALGVFFWSALAAAKLGRDQLAAPLSAAVAAGLILISYADGAAKLREASGLYRSVSAAIPLVAASIERNSTAHDFVLLEPLGFIGFQTFDRRFMDYPGLCSPAVVASLKTIGHKLGSNLADYEALRTLNRDFKPPILVLRKQEFDLNTEKQTIGNYRLVDLIPVGGGSPDGPIAHGEVDYCILKRSGGGDPGR